MDMTRLHGASAAKTEPEKIADVPKHPIIDFIDRMRNKIADRPHIPPHLRALYEVLGHVSTVANDVLKDVAEKASGEAGGENE